MRLEYVVRGTGDAAVPSPTMSVSVKQMMEVANAAVPRITPAQASEMIAKGNVLVVDESGARVCDNQLWSW